ncbi:TolC family protein [Siphonobacter aquaeclarae]|uniref:Outer membrane protein, cobalt-zinc-cadmium efflux system n=1 Tax=Siphonobacter aquaeclarae TaxID=563176 RepID=A0A1G9MKK1_9BACT|nr:TolC family protein [Siphonobacter aquaeclarae]SDL74603.1 outer membrane protein, cobalt-zinc-cadmium efflux system [Siphonobacter aquaeclarae]
MRCVFLLCLTLAALPLKAQDTLRVRLNEADSLFLRGNLLLLAEHYRINASKALELQAGLWDNPTLSVELSTYNSNRSRVLDVGKGGEKIISLQQLLYTAGKRNKRVAFASEATRLTEYEFAELMRTLKFELRDRFFESLFLMRTIRRFSEQITVLRETVEAFEKESARNNISLKEVVRLKALLFQLTNDRTEINLELTDNQRVLRNLLGTQAYILPVSDSTRLARYRLGPFTADDLKARAFRNRPDLHVTESLARQAELGLSLEKAQAVPDLQVGATYDQAGSYINNYVGISVSSAIPLLNRNQGNIRAARQHVDYRRQLLDQKKIELANEVVTAVRKVEEVEQASTGQRLTEPLDQLSKGMYENFRKRNISLLEFVDFVETYQETIREYNRLQATRIKAYEELNFTVGEELFH